MLLVKKAELLSDRFDGTQELQSESRPYFLQRYQDLQKLRFPHDTCEGEYYTFARHTYFAGSVWITLPRGKASRSAIWSNQGAAARSTSST